MVPAKQTEENEVRDFRGRSPELIPEPPFASKYYTQPLKGGSGTYSGLLPGKFANLTFFGLVCGTTPDPCQNP